MVTITAGNTEAELVIPTRRRLEWTKKMDQSEQGCQQAETVSSTKTIAKPRFKSWITTAHVAAREKMATPTVVPADGRLEIWWEEPAHTGEREIDRYQITWTINNIPRRITAQGYRRHHSLRGPRNGATYAVQIQACKEGTTYCSELSDTVSATPTDSGPTMTGPQTATLPEEAAGTVGQFTATPSTGGTIAWRLGGFESKLFSHTVNADGNMTLRLNEGYNVDDPKVMRQHHNLRVTVVATDSAPGQASSVIETTVTVTDVDETPIFTPNRITKGPYVAGEEIEAFLLPTPKADEVPITYEITELPAGLSWYGTRLIQGTPSQHGTHTAIYRATDVDGDWGELTIKFIVVRAGERLEIDIEPEQIAVGGSGTIRVKGVKLDPDITYGVTGHLINDKARFDPACTVQTQLEEIETFLLGERVQSFVVHGCQPGTETFTATLIRNGTPVDTVATNITVKSRLTPPTNLDIIPLPADTFNKGRQALLTWKRQQQREWSNRLRHLHPTRRQRRTRRTSRNRDG